MRIGSRERRPSGRTSAAIGLTIVGILSTWSASSAVGQTRKVVLGTASAVTSQAGWHILAPGLEFRRFPPPSSVASLAPADSPIVVLRVDPKAWDLKLATQGQSETDSARTVRGWAASNHFVAAINAGRVQPDQRTHLGYMVCDSDTNSSRVTDYQSAFAIHPNRPGSPPFWIFDLDEIPLADVLHDYNCVVQNDRLIRRMKVNTAKPSEDRAPRAVLGQDVRSWMLYIHSQVPCSREELNIYLLTLPIGLASSQEVEAGPAAQMFVGAGGLEAEFFGQHAWKAGATVDSTAPPVPNVLGIVPR